ncbi:MAG: hypothetical protein ACE5MI_11110 [Acidimicrobiia bacterium]
MISAQDVTRVVRAARSLPPTEETYLDDDFVMSLLETVLDYRMNTLAVARALDHFRDERWDEVRTLDDLEDVFTRFPDDKEGNTGLAQYLWGYDLWTRAHQLRELAQYFGRIGVSDEEQLRRWAERSEFKRDFEGRVKGLGIAVYQWLVMRQGVDTVKPDVHVRRFAEAAVGRSLNDEEVVAVVSEAARRLGLKAFDLDWRIWKASRGRTPPHPTAPISKDT